MHFGTLNEVSSSLLICSLIFYQFSQFFLMYSFNECCQELLSSWRSRSLNNELWLQSNITSIIRPHIHVLFKQLIWIDKMYTFVDQTITSLEPSEIYNKIILLVLKKLIEWAITLQNIVHVSIYLFNFN